MRQNSIASCLLTLTAVVLGPLLGSPVAISQREPRIGDTGPPGTIQAFAVSDDATLGVVADYNGRLILLNLRSGHTEILVKNYPYAVNELTISPRTSLVAIADIGRIPLVSLTDTTHRTHTIDLGRDVSSEISVGGLAFSQDGHYLAGVCAESGSVMVWDVANRAEFKRLGPCSGGQQYTAFSHDGRRLAAVCNENLVRIWDLDNSRQVRDLSVGPDAWVNWIRFSRDGRWLFAATGGTNLIQIFDLSTGEIVSTLKGHTDQVESFGFQTDALLVSTSNDNTVRVWNTNTGTLLRTSRIPNGSIAANGSVVLVQAEEPGILEVWDVRTGTRIKNFRLWTKGRDPMPK